MDSAEILVFLVSGFLVLMFLSKWYQALFDIWPSERIRLARYIFGCLPVISFIIIAYTLKVLAAFDVINDFIYIIFYIILGYAWIYFGLILMSYLFDLSWIDDALNLNNKAALISITGGFIGLTIIYSGANIGDGPGWWCVIFAGGLGLIAWIVLGVIIGKITNLFERITVGRDISCGIRTGFYLLASGIILGRATAGDWTSFYMTMVEFTDGWPVLILTALGILIELYYIRKSEADYNIDDNYLFGSVFWGITYLAIAVVSIMILPPLKENPMYGGVSALFTWWGGVL